MSVHLLRSVLQISPALQLQLYDLLFGRYPICDYHNTASSISEDRVPLLVSTSEDESPPTFSVGRRGKLSTMASKDVAQTSAIETQRSTGFWNGTGEVYAPDRLEGTGDKTADMEMRAPAGEDGVNAEVLEHALEALEGKKKVWYAYLLTKDFWLVMLIG